MNRIVAELCLRKCSFLVQLYRFLFEALSNVCVVFSILKALCIIFVLMTIFFPLSLTFSKPELFVKFRGNILINTDALRCYFSLMGGLFPMPRIVYAMAQDGLIFRFLGNINKRFKTPLIATLVSGVLTGK